MNFPKLFMIVAVALFGIIALLSLFKNGSENEQKVSSSQQSVIEVDLEQEVRSVTSGDPDRDENVTQAVSSVHEPVAPRKLEENLPDADRIEEFFRKVDPRLPIVETITYTSRVDWLKGRPAWISDYASHYKTSRHFIARSLNGKKNYEKQNVAIGDRFNVMRLDKNISFYLVIDITRSKLWFYYYDEDDNSRVLLKTYPVGLGRVDSSQPSGLLTPLGKYSLGEKVGIYKIGKKGLFNGEKTEMIRVFGTRWIPFQEEQEGATAPAKGFGIHGLPWKDGENGELFEDFSCLGKYESDGCVRLASQDIEELFSIIITKPSYVLLVKDFFDATLPGNEKR